MHEFILEVGYSISLWAGNRLDLDPLGELVDGHQDSIESVDVLDQQPTKVSTRGR
jgi:hypothetical protein